MPRALRRGRQPAVLPACALALAACSSSPPPRARPRPLHDVGHHRRSTTSTSAAAGTTSSTTQTSGTLVPQTATVTEFYSPSKNISCEIDNNFGSSATTSALCLTISPPKSVTLMTDSTLNECTGVNCLSNAGENTPTLAYGQSITLGTVHLRLVDGGHQVHAGQRRRVPHFEQPRPPRWATPRWRPARAEPGSAVSRLSRALRKRRRSQLCCGSLVRRRAVAVAADARVQPHADGAGLAPAARALEVDDLVPAPRLGAEQGGIGQGHHIVEVGGLVR